MIEIKTPVELKAYRLLGLVRSEDARDIAASLLNRGFHEEALVDLATSAEDSHEEIDRLLARVVANTPAVLMTRIDALRLYAQSISEAILKAEISPYEGASEIWRVALTINQSDFHELDTFIYAASEMEDRPQDRHLFEAAVIEEAKRWQGR